MKILNHYYNIFIKIPKSLVFQYFTQIYRQQIICLKNKNALKLILVRRFFETFFRSSLKLLILQYSSNFTLYKL